MHNLILVRSLGGTLILILLLFQFLLPQVHCALKSPEHPETPKKSKPVQQAVSAPVLKVQIATTVPLASSNVASAVVEGLKNALASGIASAVVKTTLQPFDTIKTIQQYATESLSALEATRIILQRSGWKGLYSGLGVTIIGAVPSVATYFGSYQYFKKRFEAQGWNRYMSILVAAGLGNTLASYLRVPYEVVKQRLQAGVYPSTKVALIQMYKEGGLRSFFCKGGVGIQMARDVPYAMLTLLVYETLQRHLRPRVDPKRHGWLNIFIGGFAGGVGTWLTNPMDVVKTRVMVITPEHYTGLSSIVRNIVKNEGYLAFFKGSCPRLLHRVPANAVFFVVYEFVRTLLRIQR